MDPQRLTDSLCRLPGVQAAIPVAIQVRIFVAIRRHRVDVQIVRRPSFAVRHHAAGCFLSLRCKALRQNTERPERQIHRDGYDTNRQDRLSPHVLHFSSLVGGLRFAPEACPDNPCSTSRVMKPGCTIGLTRKFRIIKAREQGKCWEGFRFRLLTNAESESGVTTTSTRISTA